jgi:RNA polymerase sigma factor (sigma-70 family)
MSAFPLDTVVRHLRRVVGPAAGTPPTDAELLERFVSKRDAGAFELLVWRHQKMVFGVCRRVLREEHDAEDAFQATFLALARKAGSISKRQALAGWLYQVAHRVALRARAGIDRRRGHECSGDVAGCPDSRKSPGDQDLLAVLDGELGRLPAKYREPVILCYLQGKTYDEAAQILGCPRGTLSTRLTHARSVLRARLLRHGLALSTATLATHLCAQAAEAAAPAALVTATVQTVASPGGAVPVTVAALTEGVLQAMFWSKMKVVLGVVVLIAVFGGGGVLLLPSWGPAARGQTQGQVAPVQSGEGTAQPTWQLRKTLEVESVADVVALSPDGKVLATSSGKKSGQVRVWDIETGIELATLPVNKFTVRALAFSPDGKTLATAVDPGDKHGGLLYWDMSTRKIRAQTAEEAPAILLEFARDGRFLSALDVDGKVRLYDDLGKEQMSRTFKMQGKLTRAVWAPPNKMVAVIRAGESDVLIIDVETGSVTRQLKVEHPRTLALSPDGRWLALGGEKNNRPILRVEDAKTGKGILEFVGDKETIRAAFSPDGKWLATAADDQVIRLWDMASGKELSSVKSAQATVVIIIFSGDGKRLVSSGGDGTVRIWDLAASGKTIELAPPGPGVGERLTTLVNSLVKAKKTDEQAIEALCLATLSRLPTETESTLMQKHIAGKKDRAEALLDVVWALVNSQEFHANVEALRKQDPHKK